MSIFGSVFNPAAVAVTSVNGAVGDVVLTPAGLGAVDNYSDETIGGVKSFAELVILPTLYFGDDSTDGTWRIVSSGNNLVFERRESGAYVTKSVITP